jgi:hypothetical protein
VSGVVAGLAVGEGCELRSFWTLCLHGLRKPLMHAQRFCCVAKHILWCLMLYVWVQHWAAPLTLWRSAGVQAVRCQTADAKSL